MTGSVNRQDAIISLALAQRRLQSIVTEDPFDILGLVPSFDLDRDRIERAFLRRLAKVHPDTIKSARDQDASLDADRASSRLTEARSVLQSPELRANALLARLGGPGKGRDTSLPPGFLQQILQTREEIDRAVASESPAQLEHWTTWAHDEQQRYRKRVGDLFRRAGDPPDGLLLGEIRTLLNAWRYIERLIEQLDPQYDPNRADFA